MITIINDYFGNGYVYDRLLVIVIYARRKKGVAGNKEKDSEQ